MSNSNLRNITNHFQDVQLVSMASFSIANEVSPRDRGGPYVVLQAGFDPEDPRVIADEFVLGRSGKWMSLSHFFKLSVPDRRAEFVFGTAAEVMKIMRDLPPRPAVIHPGAATPAEGEAPEGDEMAAAIKAAKAGAGGSAPAAS